MTLSTNEDLRPRQYVLDTSVLISDPLAIYNFDEHDVVIAMTVLEELDHIKDSKSPNSFMKSKDARTAIQTIKAVIFSATSDELANGVPIGKNTGKLRVINDYEISQEKMGLKSGVEDNRILSVALSLQQNEKTKSTILVTKDINLQVKALVAKLEKVEDYLNEKQLDDISLLASGFFESQTPFFDDNSTENPISIRQDKDKSYYTFMKIDLEEELLDTLHLNQYWFHDKTDGVFKVSKIDEDSVEALYIKKSQIMNLDAMGIKPKNIKQAFAMHALLDPSIDMVQLTGPAGSGKTIVALAAALEQSGAGGTKLYDKIILTRNTPEMTDEIGFLPGSEEEKMAPWLAAFTDTLEAIVGTTDTEGNTQDKLSGAEAQKTTIHYLQKSANIQYKSTTFMRGRSIQNGLFILDESQNLTRHQMRSLITRMGKGSKLIVLGNLGQIDAKYVTALTSGLTHSVEKMKNYSGGAVMNLPGGERSALSAFAEEHL